MPTKVGASPRRDPGRRTGKRRGESGVVEGKGGQPRLHHCRKTVSKTLSWIHGAEEEKRCFEEAAAGVKKNNGPQVLEKVIGK